MKKIIQRLCAKCAGSNARGAQANPGARRLAWAMLVAASLLAPWAQAQNLIVNPGFENNPPTAFGNNIGHPITPWILGGGNTSNVVRVNGDAAYGSSGPALDADPASGVGVFQHYLDIASGSNDFYQSFTVPVCGGTAGQTRTATFSGWFSTRDNLSGSGSVSIRQGAGATGTVLAIVNATLPAPVSPQTSGTAPWVQVSGTVNVVSGSTISYVVSMGDNLNFDQAVLSFNAVTCVTSAITLEKAWSGAALNDTATVTLTRAGTVIESFASTANTATEVDSDPTPAVAFQGETLTLAELLGASNAGSYGSALGCSGGGTLSGNTLTIGATGAPVVCRYTNTRLLPDISITKTNTPGVNGNVDQANDTVLRGATTSYAITVRNSGVASANGTVIRDPAQAGLSCASVSCAVSAGTATCPAVSVAALQSAAGVTIATLPASSALTFTLGCTVQ